MTLIGLIPRLLHFDNSIVGDELSTAFIIGNDGLLGTITTVATDAEISPPLYFVLAWLSTKLSAAPEMVRLPALIAGTASIPLTYLVGRRALSRPAGLIAATVMALNPFMIFYATDARGYTVAIALLLGSSLAMLAAVQTARRRWWVLYGALSCLCMYTHYTTAFVLGAQLLWLLWAHPQARKAAIVANVAAALAYLPWVPSLLEDFRAPTLEILSLLQGDGFAVKRDAVESWAFGYPFNTVDQVPGRLAVTVAITALAVAAIVAALGSYRSRREREGGSRPRLLSGGMTLVLLLFLATPVAELTILALGGSDLFGARNLNTASGGFALSIGAILAAAGPLWGGVSGAAVLAVFAIGATRSLETDVSTIDFKSAAEFIDAEATDDDVVLDMLSPVISPVPLTALDAHLPQTREEYRAYLPLGGPPFLDLPPPPGPIVAEAFRAAEGKRLFLVAADGALAEDGEEGTLRLRVPPVNPAVDEVGEFRLPRDASLLEERSFDGLGPVNVYEIELNGAP